MKVGIAQWLPNADVGRSIGPGVDRGQSAHRGASSRAPLQQGTGCLEGDAGILSL
jgi:hypothetical protein